MLPPSEPPSRSDTFEPEKKAPEGVEVNWVGDAVGWPWPTWLQKELFEREFAMGNTGQLVVELFNSFRSSIEKALATTLADDASIPFKYWRKISSKATKMKPLKLRGHLYQHPEYDRIWLHITYDNN